MDLLREAMAERSKTLVSKKKWSKKADSDSSDDDEPPKKYMRRGEIKQMLKAKVKEQEKTVDTKKDRSEGLTKVMSREKEIDSDDEENLKVSARYKIGPDEVKRRLRACLQPLTLFGETDNQRLSRLKLFELNAIEKHGASDGVGNEFADIIAREVESEILQATVAAMESENKEEAAKILAKKARIQEKRHSKYANAKERDQFDCDDDYIIFFFKRVLSCWELEIDERTADKKKSTKGKVASATHKQTRQYIRPFFKELKRGEVPPDLKAGVLKIVNESLIREYVKAHEAYMMIAIGNAAWPMGVTNVGIHERAGRSKIFKSNIAHVLNSETSRKYIQAMKRILTFCQHKFPNVPSKCVY